MNKPIRNMSTPEARAFWERAEAAAREVDGWTEDRKMGLCIPSQRSEPRSLNVMSEGSTERRGERHVSAPRGRPPIAPADRKIQIRGSLSPGAARALAGAWLDSERGTAEERTEIADLLLDVIRAARRRRKSAS